MKEKPVELESVLLYSDIGLGGKCPICAELNSIKNKSCAGCGQTLNKVAKELIS